MKSDAPQKVLNKPTKITISVNFNRKNFDALKRYESTEVDRKTWLHFHLELACKPKRPKR